jgi:hypothetical protein
VHNEISERRRFAEVLEIRRDASDKEIREAIESKIPERGIWDRKRVLAYYNECMLQARLI